MTISTVTEGMSVPCMDPNHVNFLFSWGATDGPQVFTANAVTKQTGRVVASVRLKVMVSSQTALEKQYGPQGLQVLEKEAGALCQAIVNELPG